MSPDALTPEFIHVFEPARGDTTRTLLLLHGTGGDEHDLLPLGRALDPSAALLSPRGKVLENGMPRFFRRLAEGVFDREDLIRRTHELADFVASACAHYHVAPEGVVAAGFSNGANIAASLLLLRPETLAGAVLFRAMVPLEPETPPKLSGRSVYLAAGRNDPLIAPEGSQRLADLLGGFGAEVALEWSEGGHNLSASDVESARRWLRGVERPHQIPGTSR